MNTRSSQRGFTLGIYVVIIAAIAIGAYLIYQERQAMLKTIEDKNEIISQQKTSIETLEQANAKLLDENKNLNRQITLLNEIADNNDRERQKREKKIHDLESAYKALTLSLPVALPDAQVAPATEYEAQNSILRINYIWNIFQMDHEKLNQIQPPGLPSPSSLLPPSRINPPPLK